MYIITRNGFFYSRYATRAYELFLQEGWQCKTIELTTWDHMDMIMKSDGIIIDVEYVLKPQDSLSPPSAKPSNFSTFSDNMNLLHDDDTFGLDIRDMIHIIRCNGYQGVIGVGYSSIQDQFSQDPFQQDRMDPQGSQQRQIIRQRLSNPNRYVDAMNIDVHIEFPVQKSIVYEFISACEDNFYRSI